MKGKRMYLVSQLFRQNPIDVPVTSNQTLSLKLPRYQHNLEV